MLKFYDLEKWKSCPKPIEKCFYIVKETKPLAIAIVGVWRSSPKERYTLCQKEERKGWKHPHFGASVRGLINS